MSLEDYWAKRDFNMKPEPHDEAEPGAGRRLVVHEQHASNLHYARDLRMERDGFMKSWAIPKGPPLRLGARRLAVQTEDHPVAYISFEARASGTTRRKGGR